MTITSIILWAFVALLWLFGLGMVGWDQWRSHAARRDRFAATRLQRRLMMWNVLSAADSENSNLTDELVRKWTQESAYRVTGGGFGMLVASSISGGILYLLRETPFGTSQDVLVPLVCLGLIGCLLGVTLAPPRRSTSDHLLWQTEVTMSPGRPKTVLLFAAGIPLLYGVSTLLVVFGIARNAPDGSFYHNSGRLDPHIYPWAVWVVPIACVAIFLTSELAIRMVSQQALPRLSSDAAIARRAAQKLRDVRLAGL